MPIHVHPALRVREEVMQTAGLIVPLNSDGLINQKNAELAGQAFRLIPAEGPIIFSNTSYQPNATLTADGKAIVGGVVAGSR
jgi:hypothetical protein